MYCYLYVVFNEYQAGHVALRKTRREELNTPRLTVSQDITDVELVEQIATGSVTAFEKLMSRNLTKIVSFANHILSDEGEAEDVAQESFLKLWHLAEKYDPQKAKFTTWFYKIVTNLCIDKLRKYKKEKHNEPLDKAYEITQDINPDKNIEQQQLARRVQAEIFSLPERQRLALVLCHYQSLKIHEASEIMDISRDAMESLVARARRNLKQSLSKEWRELLPENGQDD